MSHVDSPFQKKRTEFHREPTTYESFRDYAVSKFNDMFLAYLPSDDIKAMSPEYLYPLGTLAFLSLLGIFLAVFLNGYYTSVNTTYLSPSSGTTASKHCVAVPSVSTGTYLATQTGYWQGSDDFKFAEATFDLALTSTAFTTDQYSYLMNRVYSNLDYVKNISVNYDLAANLVYWMSAAFVPYPGNTAQRLTLMGAPQVVFDREKIVGTVSNVYGDCNATSTATFDSANGILSLVYDYDEYVNNPICNDTVTPEIMDYFPNTDGSKFTIQLDTRSIITAVAVNMGIIDIVNLVELTVFRVPYTLEGEVYNVSQYYDPKYSGMAPISCITMNNTQIVDYTFCALVIAKEVYAIPLFNHIGKSEELPILCNCSTLTAAQKANAYYSCNVFSFLTGVLFFPTQSPDDITEMWMAIGTQVINTVKTSPVNGMAYEAMYIASYFGKFSPYRDALNSPANRESAYSFCNTGNGPCSLITFTTFDSYVGNWAVTKYYYQLLTGACQNTFVPTYANWQALIDTPYAPLNQDYQKCNYDVNTVIINQAGSSVGTVSILAPLSIAFILVLVYYAQVCGVVTIKKTYTETEKKHALDDLALKLLLARDRDKANLEKGSVLARLVEELGQELDESDNIYHTGDTNSSSQPAVSVDWTSLKAAVGLKKRQSAMTGNAHGSASTDSSVQQSTNSMSSAAIAAKQQGLEMQHIGSPMHLHDVASAVMAVKAGKNKYIILNDFEVSPDLLQLVGAPGGKRRSPKVTKKKSPGRPLSTDMRDDDRLEAGGLTATHGSAGTVVMGPDGTAQYNWESLYDLLDNLIAAFEAAQEDRTKTVWSLASQSAILRIIKISTLPKPDVSKFYFKLYTLLALHAAAVMNVPVTEVKHSEASHVAYMVGLEVLTLQEIRTRL